MKIGKMGKKLVHIHYMTYNLPSEQLLPINLKINLASVPAPINGGLASL